MQRHKKNLQEFNFELSKDWHPNKNKNLTPIDVTPGSDKKVWWQCEKKHEWEAVISSRAIGGSGCPYCSGRIPSNEYNLGIINPELAKQWDYKKNGNLTPFDVTPGSGKKVWWICENKHEWQTSIYHRTKGNGCPYCSNRIISKENSLAINNPTLSKEWHFEKNGYLTPFDVTSGSGRRVWWQCEKGHEWRAQIASRASKGSGCPYCLGRNPSNEYNLGIINPELAKQWDYKKNGNLTPFDVTPGSGKKVWWICEDKHEWEAVIEKRTNGKGCPFCSNRVTNIENCLASLNKNLAKEWHREKNGNLTPYDVVPGSGKRVWWQCEKGHEWEAVISSRNGGRGCPKCSSATSFPEQAIFYYLSSNFEKVSNRKKIDGIEVDVFIEKYNIGVEYDGFYYHHNRYKEDKRKTHELLNKKIQLIRLREKPLKPLNINGLIEFIVDYQNLKVTLAKLFETIEELTNQKIIKDFDLDNDRYLIFESFKFLEREDSIGNHPKLSKEWHPKKNSKLDPFTFSINSAEKVWWICEKGHEYKTNIYNRNQGTGCPYCTGRKVDKDNCLATINNTLANEWHHEKNGNLTPYNVTANAGYTVWWKCEKGHEWKARIIKRNSRGDGCPFCSGRKVNQENCLANVNEDIAKEWHPEKNMNLSPYDVTLYSNKKVWWKCEKGHEWYTSISSRTSKNRGCPYCSGNKASVDYNLAIINPTLAKEWHPKKNNNLTPNDVTPNSGKKQWWICEKKHEWQASIAKRNSRGDGCPYCSGRRKKSSCEKNHI